MTTDERDAGEMRVLQGQGFRARAIRFPRKSAFPRHTHHNGHLVLVYDGEWIDHLESGQYRLRRGDVLFHPGRFEHEAQAAAGTAVVIIDISHTVLAFFSSLYGNHLPSIHFEFEDVNAIPARIYGEISRADEATSLVVQSLVLQLLAIGSRAAKVPQRRKPEWMPHLVAYIDAHLGERLTITRLAAVAGVSESHLSHSFARHFDCSVTEYVRDSRLRGAARALRQTNDSVQQIALNFGFSDQAHFTRTFKPAYRVTPTEYRAMRTAWDEALWMERVGEP